MVQFWMVVDMHVAVQMTGLWFRQCKTAVFRNCSALTRLSMSLLLQSSTRCGLPCDLAATVSAVGGASDTAHRHSQRTIQLHRDGSAFSAGDGDEGDFRGFSTFFALLRVVPELSSSFASPR